MYCWRKVTLSLTNWYSGCYSMLHKCLEYSFTFSGLNCSSRMLFIIIMEEPTMAGNIRKYPNVQFVSKDRPFYATLYDEFWHKLNSNHFYCL